MSRRVGATNRAALYLLAFDAKSYYAEPKHSNYHAINLKLSLNLFLRPLQPAAPSPPFFVGLATFVDQPM